MIDRYSAPMAQSVFSDETKWGRINTLAKLQMSEFVPAEYIERIKGIGPDVSPQTVAEYEKQTGHDVVAFLQALEERTPPDLRWTIHLGLTSSDLIENVLHSQLCDHADEVRTLLATLGSRMATPEYPRAGRTHGQVAELTTYEHQIRVQKNYISLLLEDLNKLDVRLVISKSPGPTGSNWLDRENLPGYRLVRSTQVIPRGYLLEWATVYLRIATHLEQLANFVRFGARQEIGELREGTVRVGSSSMVAKRNPIDSEKVCGLARVARGCFLAIAETAGNLWEDRDISNSSVERVAVPDLAATVEHMLIVMTGVMDKLVINAPEMKRNGDRPICFRNFMQARLQYWGNVPYSDAAAMIEHLYAGAEYTWESFNRDGKATITLVATKNVAEDMWADLAELRTKLGLTNHG